MGNKEKRILRDEKRIVSLLEDEMLLFKDEIKSIDSAINAVRGSIQMHEDKFFSSEIKNRAVLLTGIFSSLLKAMKECNKEKQLGHIDRFKDIKQELEHLRSALESYGRLLENPRPINSQREAIYMFDKIVLNSFKRVKEELNKVMGNNISAMIKLRRAA